MINRYFQMYSSHLLGHSAPDECNTQQKSTDEEHYHEMCSRLAFTLMCDNLTDLTASSRQVAT